MTVAGIAAVTVAAIATVLVLNELAVKAIDKFAGPDLGTRDFGERSRVPDGFKGP